jgi:branched-chain amino acid transport system permease protein
MISVKMLIMAALGGAGLLFGPLVGAVILVPLEELSNSLLGGAGSGLTFLVYGAIIVLIARLQPGGILRGTLDDALRLVRLLRIILNPPRS